MGRDAARAVHGVVRKPVTQETGEADGEVYHLEVTAALRGFSSREASPRHERASDRCRTGSECGERKYANVGLWSCGGGPAGRGITVWGWGGVRRRTREDSRRRHTYTYGRRRVASRPVHVRRRKGWAGRGWMRLLRRRGAGEHIWLPT